MRKFALCALLSALAAHAQIRPLPAGEGRQSLTFSSAEDVFPHIAIGGVWSTEITFVNMGGALAVFPLEFYRPDGSPWPVTVPGLGTHAQWQVPLQAGRIVTLPFQSAGSVIETGWALIQQPEGARIGGHVIFQDRTAGRPLFEAVVPLSRSEKQFFLPFDNTAGSTTCYAVVNAFNTGTTTLIEIFGQDGASLVLLAGAWPAVLQASGCLPTDYPATAGKRGVVKFSSPDAFFSALGLRFNPGGAFTTLFPMSEP